MPDGASRAYLEDQSEHGGRWRPACCISHDCILAASEPPPATSRPPGATRSAALARVIADLLAARNSVALARQDPARPEGGMHVPHLLPCDTFRRCPHQRQKCAGEAGECITNTWRTNALPHDRFRPASRYVALTGCSSYRSCWGSISQHRLWPPPQWPRPSTTAHRDNAFADAGRRHGLRPHTPPGGQLKRSNEAAGQRTRTQPLATPPI
jgi:hypothetical protein